MSASALRDRLRFRRDEVHRAVRLARLVRLVQVDRRAVHRPRQVAPAAGALGESCAGLIGYPEGWVQACEAIQFPK